MDIKFLENIITYFLKMIAKVESKKHIISIFDVIFNARSVLLFMPDKPTDFSIARQYISVIKDNFPKATLTLVMHDSYKNLVEDSKNYGTIFVTSHDKNIFGLPKNELTEKLTQSTYDIAIDLNPSFHLFSTYLCQKSGATLRICLEDKEREPFYNFSYRSLKNDQLNKKYRKLFTYLNIKSANPVNNA